MGGFDIGIERIRWRHIVERLTTGGSNQRVVSSIDDQLGKLPTLDRGVGQETGIGYAMYGTTTCVIAADDIGVIASFDVGIGPIVGWHVAEGCATGGGDQWQAESENDDL